MECVRACVSVWAVDCLPANILDQYKTRQQRNPGVYHSPSGPSIHLFSTASTPPPRPPQPPTSTEIRLKYLKNNFGSFILCTGGGARQTHPFGNPKSRPPYCDVMHPGPVGCWASILPVALSTC